MNFARALFRLTPVLFDSSVSIPHFTVSAASYCVKKQHRRPIKVFNPEGDEVIESVRDTAFTRGRNNSPRLSEEIKGVIELNKNHVRNRRSAEVVSRNNFENSFEHDDESDGENRELMGSPYVRLGDSNSTFENIVIKTQSRKQREKSNLFMLEGRRLIQDAILAGVIPTSIFFSRKSLVEDLSMPPGVVKLYKMPYNKIKKWSSLQTPPGIVAFCQIPKDYKPANKSNANILPVTLICDNIREPGNLGTILRTFSGVGCSEILLTKGCTDVWDSKVLRGAAGAHFHMPVKSGLTWQEINSEVKQNARVFIAHHHEEASMTVEEHTLATVPYFSINYSHLSDIVIVVGGETEGISPEAVQFARFRDGVKINIPLDNNIDSLNVGAAVSAILFEIKRQFITKSAHARNNISDQNEIKNVAVSQ